jgi:membrane-bound metal-dependent hydrolase YbcI (DUF457 family)
MKGIAHFLSGIAAASFIPAAVQQSAQGAWLLALAGACALLPDTLDFKFARFLEQPDDAIDSSPQPDAQAIANRLAAAIDAAFQTGKPRVLQLHTIKLGADTWQQYSVRFDTLCDEIAVRIGPVVSTSQVPLGGSLERDFVHSEARARISAPMDYTYDAEIKIDIFSGPSFRFERKGDRVSITFLPWHRAWSHSFTMAVGIGLMAGLLWGWLAGVVAALAYAVHVVEDQLGAMGSNLFWPFTRVRFPGLGLIRSGDAIPNFATVWTACALTLFNLDRFADTPRLPAVPYLLSVVVLPAIALVAAYVYGRYREKPRPVQTLRQADLMAETQETEV